MVDNLVDISKDPNNKQNLQRAFYYDKILTYWDTYIKDARKTINTIDRSLARSEFGKIFDSMNQEIKSGKDIIAEIKMLAVKDTLYEVLTPLMENVKKKYEERVENVKKDKNVLNLKRSEKLKNKRLKELKADFDNAYITPEKFIKILKGEMGDAHWANSMLEGYMYNQDPVVASLARYVKDHYSEMLTKDSADIK